MNSIHIVQLRFYTPASEVVGEHKPQFIFPFPEWQYQGIKISDSAEITVVP